MNDKYLSFAGIHPDEAYAYTFHNSYFTQLNEIMRNMEIYSTLISNDLKRLWQIKRRYVFFFLNLPVSESSVNLFL